MLANLLPYVMPYIASLVVSVVVMVIAWTRRRVPGVREYALVISFQALSIFAYIFELLASDLSAKIFWDDLQWVGFSGIVVFFALFALRFSQHPLGHDRRLMIALFAVPTVFFALLVTNASHCSCGSVGRVALRPPIS